MIAIDAGNTRIKWGIHDGRSWVALGAVPTEEAGRLAEAAAGWPPADRVVACSVARIIIAVDMHDGTEAAMRMCGAVFAAVWVQERNIGDPKVLDSLVIECGLSPKRGEQSQSQAVQERYEAYTQEAIDTQVFGAPSYVIDGEIFWGQDRLDFVERALRP